LGYSLEKSPEIDGIPSFGGFDSDATESVGNLAFGSKRYRATTQAKPSLCIQDSAAENGKIPLVRRWPWIQDGFGLFDNPPELGPPSRLAFSIFHIAISFPELELQPGPLVKRGTGHPYITQTIDRD
jgi:hypothetical protein